MSGFISSFLNAMAITIWEYLVKHICFIIQAGDKVNELEREAGILEDQQKDIEQQIQKDKAAMKEPTTVVKGWLLRVKDIQPIAKAESIKTEYDQRNCVFLGTCSFNCLSSYSIGKKAAEELGKVEKEIKFIRDGVKEITVEVIQPSVQFISNLPVQFGRETFELQLNQALNFLGGDNKLGTLGIWGMGGVGKTTLLQHINNTMEKKMFDNVVFVNASRKCTIENIQKQIVEKLGLSGRGNHTTNITNYLRNRSFAILLDDVWQPLQLYKAGVPFPLGVEDGEYRRKLILTSRSEKVCCKMGACQSTLIKVKVLGPKDARLLFRSRVGEEIISSNQTIQVLADKAADLCGGLPVALNAIGGAMAGTSDVQVWNHALDELRESKSKFFETHEIAGEDDDPLPLLKFSYDHLKDPMKQECFLHCALWPEISTITREELIRCWMGHGLLGEFDDVEKAYRKGHFVIDSLQKACLLESVKSKWRRKEGVKLHDVIRDMALWITSNFGQNEKWMVLSGDMVDEALQDEKLWNQAEKISIQSSSFSRSPTKVQITSTKLTTLILTRNSKLEHNGLSILKYLHTLQYLDLSFCYRIEEFPVEICGLTKLEYLNLSYTSIKSLPMELKALVNLKFLLLRGIIVHSMPHELLSYLVSLFELDLFGPHNFNSQSAVINQLDSLNGRLKALSINVSSVSDFRKLAGLSGISIRALYIQGLRDLTSHSLQLMSPHFLGRQHMCSKLKKLCISTAGSSLEELVIEGKRSLLLLDTLNIVGEEVDGVKGLKEIIWKGVEPQEVFPSLRELFIYKSELEHVTWILKLPCLEDLRLRDCKNMEQLMLRELAAKTEERVPSLVYLELRNLGKLSSICDGELTLPSLESFRVSSCPELKKLPFHSPDKIRRIRRVYGEKEWWESLDLEDSMRNFLQPFFQESALIVPGRYSRNTRYQRKEKMTNGMMPFIILCIVKENFENWNIQMKALLGSHDTWNVIENDNTKSEGTEGLTNAQNDALKDL